jgi:acetyl-CoA synthetase
MADDSAPTIEALFSEDRTFPPPPEFAARANISSPDIYVQSKDLESYWDEMASKLSWRKPYTQVLDWSNAPFAKWFADGTLNITESCLDRHLGSQGDKVAYYWEGENGDRRSLTYRDLHTEVCRFAGALRQAGVGVGDRVAIYMGMVPELPVAMLACARLGAAHSVVFGGYSADALRDRINDASAKVLVTCDGAWRNGEIVPLKAMADDALSGTSSVETVFVLRRTGAEIAWTTGRDRWWHEAVEDQPDELEAVEVPAEQMLFILYTSGTTAKPKGIVHTTGGYLVGTSTTHRQVFDLKADDVYWCSADVGWVTGHSYVVYGPLANGATSVIYEGVPHFPEKDRTWEIIERYKVSIFYTAPTLIRTFVKWGESIPAGHDLSSLRLLGTVGEPINPEAWMWYHSVVGHGRCPIVDTWWQTETGQIMISPLPGVTATKPGSATVPLPGVSIDVLDDAGRPVPLGGGGYLVIERPWPAMLRTIYNDDDRFVQVYWERFSKPEENRWVYFAGDGVKRDADGYLWLLGRVDDVMNVSGHRISTLEVESALVDHPAVAEAAVVGRADEHTGQAIAAFVTLKGGVVGSDALVADIRAHVALKIGKIARPVSIVITDELPKTRSGKIMRRLLRDISEQRQLGDVSTLANAGVMTEIAARQAATTTTAD